MNPAARRMFPMHPSTPPFHYRFPIAPPPPPFYQAVPAPPVVVPVWASNFKDESVNLRSIACQAHYVAINVQYPGLVVHLAGQDHNTLTVEQRYELVKANVDKLKPLQVGIALSDSHGVPLATWEFNLCDFRPADDPHDKDSLAYLAGRGLHVGALHDRGISTNMLGALLLQSGLINNPRSGRSWITYTGVYHVAYLVKIISGGAPLPPDVDGFLRTVRFHLGEEVYDVARMAANCQTMPLGLERIAAHLGFHPPSRSHRLAAAAGVHALQVFMRLKYREFRGNVHGYRGLLQGLHH